MLHKSASTRRDDRPLILSLFMAVPGHHMAAWRHPDALTSERPAFAPYRALAEEAERNLYDMLFVADALHFGDRSTGRRYPGGLFEPITLLGALATVTDRIGLGATISTTYSAPFTVARMLASLDHLSGGRIAWNIVTSISESEARNFGLTSHLDHEERYARALDYVEVVRKLWDSWEDGAVLADKLSGVAFDVQRIHPIDHHSRFFDVAGPANIARPPQGHPVLIQAGASDAGQNMAAQVADAVFTAQNNLDSARRFYASLKARAAAQRRSPDQIAILPGISPIVGGSEAEAQSTHRQLQDLIDPVVGVAMLSQILGDFDLSGVDVDKPLPKLDVRSGSLSRAALLTGIGNTERMTVRELYTRVASARGHFAVMGDAEQVAEAMIEWFVERGADGFNVMPALVPESFAKFNELVLPILRSRGFARSEYNGVTLRDNLALPRPENQFATKG